MIIAIDGPAGSGKSTIAKKIAEKYGYVYLDTGAMYRGVALFLLRKKIPLNDVEVIRKQLSSFAFEIHRHDGTARYFLGDEDVTDALRSQEVTAVVSPISALPFIRDILVAMQRRLAENLDIVAEGRDMGTVVFPKAQVKIFLTANPEVRGERRLKEMIEKKLVEEGAALSKEKVVQDIVRRDKQDSTREVAPLKRAEDAVVIDTTELDIDGAVDAVSVYIDRVLGR